MCRTSVQKGMVYCQCSPFTAVLNSTVQLAVLQKNTRSMLYEQVCPVSNLVKSNNERVEYLPLLPVPA